MQVIEHLAHFNKKIFSLLVLLFTLSNLNAQIFPDKSVHKILKNGIELIINQKYDEAEKIYQDLLKVWPAHDTRLVEIRTALNIAKDHA